MQQWPQLLLHEALPPPAPLGAPPSRVRVAELIFPCCSQMDKKYNENWIVAIGQGFAFEVTHEVKHVLWMYFCDIAVLVCKAGARQVGT